MKHHAALTVVLTLTLAAAPLRAETEAQGADEGFSLIEEGAKIILRSLLDDMEPALDEMQNGLGTAVEELGPVLRNLAAMMGDIRNYHAPEMLPNGDIIIRRKPGAPPPPPLGDGLRDLTTPNRDGPPVLPVDPYAPEIEL